MTADLALRPIDCNGHLPTYPPEYQHPEDDEAFAALAAAYLPDDQPVY